METSYKHSTHLEQREFERIRNKTSSSKKTDEGGGGSGGNGGKPPTPPSTKDGLIAGAINSENASPRIYEGVRVKSSDGTITVGKVINASDRLFVFDIVRPLTIEHNNTAVECNSVTHKSDTVKYINFTDKTDVNGGITWTLTNDDTNSIKVEAVARVCVYGQNIGTLPAVPPDKEWYVDTVTDGEGCKVLRFKKFRVAHDLIVTDGTNAYLLDVNILGENVGEPTGEGVYYSKVDSTLGFRRIIGLSGITVGSSTYSTSNDTITINCDYTGVNLGTSGSGKVEVFKEISGNEWRFRRITTGSGLTVIQDADYITISNNGLLTDVDGTNVGGYLELYKDTTTSGTTRTLRFRTLLASGDIYSEQNTNDVTIKLQYVGNNLTGGDVVLYRGKTSTVSGEYNLNFRMLKAGSNIDFTGTTSDYVIINATDTTYTAANLGTSGIGKAEVYKELSGTEFRFRRLQEGTGILITQDADYVTIASTISAADGVNEGVGTYEWYMNTDIGIDGTHHLHFKTFSVAHDVDIVDNTDYYVITVNIDGNNVGAGSGIFIDKTNPGGNMRLLNFRTLVGVGGTSVNVVGDTIEISTDETIIYDAANVGGKTEIYKNATTVGLTTTFNFKTIEEGGDVYFVDSTNSVQILSNLVGYNLGSGVQLYSSKTGSGNTAKLNFKTLVNGTGIDITYDANTVTIASTVVSKTYQFANVGTGYGVWKETATVGTDTYEARFYKLLAGTGVSISLVSNDLVISSTATATGSNLGSGHIIYDHSSSGTLYFKTISPGGDIVMNSSSDNIEVYVQYNADNVGTGYQVFKNKETLSAGDYIFHFKTIAAGSGISILDDADTLTISCLGTVNVRHNSSLVGTRDNLNFIDTTTMTFVITDDGTDNEIEIKVNGNYSGVNRGSSGSGIAEVFYQLNGAAFEFKRIKSSDGFLTITQDNDYIDLKSNYDIYTEADTTASPNTVGINFNKNDYDTSVYSQPMTSNKANLVIRSNNYTTDWETPKFIVSGAESTDITLATDTYTPIWFDTVVINDTPSWVHQDTSTSPYWWFQPNDEEDFNWHVDVTLCACARAPESNATKVNIKLPQIALFDGNTFLTHLDADYRIWETGQIRDYLIALDGDASNDLTDAPNEFYLHGSRNVRLTNNTSKLNVRFKHQSGSDKYILMIYGYISIHKNGLKCDTGSAATNTDLNTN